jgi:hypothetical protein
MRFYNCLLLGLLALTACAGDGLNAAPSLPAAGNVSVFKPLYNGKDLSGWHIKDSQTRLWKANGEILLCTKGERGENGGGWLTTDREYGDFILQLEWKIPANGNSGVGLRYPKDGEPAHEGMEIQILDDTSPENAHRPPEELTGSLFAEQAPIRKADLPVGRWNKMEITCKGPWLTVVTNRVETLKINLDDLKILHGHHRQYKPVCDRPRKGFIGLQGDRGMPVEFRHILIKELYAGCSAAGRANCVAVNGPSDTELVYIWLELVEPFLCQTCAAPLAGYQPRLFDHVSGYFFRAEHARA